MKRPARLLPTLAAIALLTPGCAGNHKLSPRDRAAIHRVAVDHAMTIAGQNPGTTTGRVAGSALRYGAAYGLGVLGFGLVGGLAMEGASLVQGSRKNEISQPALKVLSEKHTDPGDLLATRMEQEVTRNGFVIDTRAPDAVIHFELQQLNMAPVDKAKLRVRPELAVRATLLDQKGRTLWRHGVSEVAEESAALPWQEYANQPRKLRVEFDKLATRVAQRLVADLKQ